MDLHITNNVFLLKSSYPPRCQIFVIIICSRFSILMVQLFNVFSSTSSYFFYYSFYCTFPFSFLPLYVFLVNLQWSILTKCRNLYSCFLSMCLPDLLIIWVLIFYFICFVSSEFSWLLLYLSWLIYF